MKICSFTPNFLPAVGGTETVTAALAQQFTIQKHSVHVLALGKSTPLNVTYPVTWYAKPIFPRLWPERIAKHLARLHQQHGFDIFVANYGCPCGYAAIQVGQKVGVPTVVVSHGGDLYVSSKDRTRQHLWKRTIYAYQHANGLIAISPYIQSLIEQINPKPRLIQNIPNGIDIAGLNVPAEKPADVRIKNQPFCLCLGNLGPMKGFDDAIRAFAKVRTQLTNDQSHAPDLQLVVVGNGELEISLKQQAKQLGLQQQVHFMGQRTGQEKNWFLQQCQFGLMPSIEEGHPLVALEYLAVGKPLICSTNAAFDGMVDDDVNGYRIPAQQPDALATAISRMLQADLHAMGQQSKSRVSAYDWPVIADRYLAFFEKVICSFRI